jgi:two-component system, LytTR family, sensor kinase
MKKRSLLLVVICIILYYLLQLTYDLPSILNGGRAFRWVPISSNRLTPQVARLAAAILFAWTPYAVLHKFYPAKKILLSVLLIASGIPAIMLLIYSVTSLWGYEMRLRNFFLDTVLVAAIYTAVGTVFYFIRYSWYKELQQKELLIQNRQSELSFLRSQINPHFLFNNLNNIYSLVYQSSAKALPAIASLSELLRYMLYDSTEKVPLQKEVDYIRKYIDLQRLRFEHVIKADMHVAGDTETVLIPPLLLISFVENAFKHGDFSSTGTGLVMNMYRNNHKLHFHCSNAKGKQQKDAGGGIGLENVKRRLLLLYPGKHLLLIEDKNNYFTVNLELEYDQ